MDCQWQSTGEREITCKRCGITLRSINLQLKRNCAIPGLGDNIQAAIEAIGLGWLHCKACEMRKRIINHVASKVGL